VAGWEEIKKKRVADASQAPGIIELNLDATVLLTLK
jgi:hypothetical protein